MWGSTIISNVLYCKCPKIKQQIDVWAKQWILIWCLASPIPSQLSTGSRPSPLLMVQHILVGTPKKSIVLVYALYQLAKTTCSTRKQKRWLNSELEPILWNKEISQIFRRCQKLSDLRVQVKPLQSVYHERVFSETVVHDHIKTVHERRSLNDSLEIRVIQSLKRQNSICRCETII